MNFEYGHKLDQSKSHRRRPSKFRFSIDTSATIAPMIYTRYLAVLPKNGFSGNTLEMATRASGNHFLGPHGFLYECQNASETLAKMPPYR